MRGRGGPAAASFLRRRGEEGTGAAEESRARRPGEGAAPAGNGGVRDGEGTGPPPHGEQGRGARGRSAAARGRGRTGVTGKAGQLRPSRRHRLRPAAAAGPRCPFRRRRRCRARPARAAPQAEPPEHGRGAELPSPRAGQLLVAHSTCPVFADGLSACSGAAPPDEDAKPFTPEKTKEIVMSLQQPAVFCNMVGNWPALHWNVENLSVVLEGKAIQFRLGLKTVDLVPQFETSCSYVEATLEEFLAWSCGQPSCLSGPFSCYDYSKYWAYADYKYIARIFEDKPEIFQDVRWSDFGFPGRSGKESTLWIGSEGANTPCHLDSYGCNLVLQVQGRSCLSQGTGGTMWNPLILSLSASTLGLNWQDADHEARVEEAITRMLVCAIKSAENPSDGDVWLNPTEVEATSHEINLQYLNKAVSAYLKCQETSVSGQARSSSTSAKQRTNTSCKRKRREVGCGPESCTLLTQQCDFSTSKAEELQKIPFGPHLIPVLPQSHKTSVVGAVAVESDGGDLLHENEGEHFGELQCKRKSLLISNDCEAAAHQMDSDCSPCTSQTALSTNDLLDCLVNPRVISLVAQLLLERMRV
ncbi:HSPB1-associated protein 1 isoform 2-T2 [Geothlypis trichas]